MRKLVPAGLAVALFAIPAPFATAQIQTPDPAVVMANPPGGATFRGGCGFVAMYDDTPGGQFGGQGVWNGVVYLAVVPNSVSGGPVLTTATAWCELRRNSSGSTVLGKTTGIGVVVDAARLTFTAAITDIMTMCTHVTIGGSTEVRCVDATSVPICPVQVCGDGGIVDQVEALTDPVACPLFAELAPVVDVIDPDILYVDPFTGDIYLFGSYPKPFYDCPPYGS
jgi:hypothetical protein